MNLHNNNRRREVSLDLTPLIDVVFLLLIFFLVTTTFTRHKTEKPNAIPVNLPGGASGSAASDQKSVFLTVTKDGRVRVDNGAPLSDEQLLNALRQLHNSNPDTIVLLRGDSGSSHGRIVDVLDKVKLSGFQKVNLVVKKTTAIQNPSDEGSPQ